MRSARAERRAGMFVVFAIFVSACVAGYEAVHRLIEPRDVGHPGALAAGAAVVAVGAQIADPIIGLAITVVILRITRDSWRTVRAGTIPEH